MKVLHLASGDLWAGAEVQIYQLCRFFAATSDIDLHVVLLNEGDLAQRLRSAGIDVCVFPETELSFFQIYRRLAQYCKAQQIELIHSHRSKENVLAAMCKVSPSVRSIRTAHGASEFNYPYWSLKRLQPQLEILATRFLQERVVAVSEDLKRKLLASYAENKLTCIANGMALVSQNVLPAIEKSADVVHVGLVGRLVPVKRVDLLLRAARCVIDSNPAKQYQFWVVGDGPCRAESEALARDLGIAESVKFIGHVDSALPYLALFNVLLMCSDHEGTPMTLLEALHVGCPIVAHDVGGLRELLADGECGTLVAEHTPQAYAAAIETVVSDEDYAAEKVQHGKQRVLRNYDIKVTAARYADLYQSVLAAAN